MAPGQGQPPSPPALNALTTRTPPMRMGVRFVSEAITAFIAAFLKFLGARPSRLLMTRMPRR